MITLPQIYIVVGVFFGAVSILSALDANNPRRLVNFAFWGLLAVSFLAGQLLGNLGNGVLALALVAVATIGLGQGKPATTTPEVRREIAMKRGDLLFLPALIIPAVALLGTLAAKYTTWGPHIIDPA